VFCCRAGGGALADTVSILNCMKLALDLIKPSKSDMDAIISYKYYDKKMAIDKIEMF
jgi:hypothetical protein